MFTASGTDYLGPPKVIVFPADSLQHTSVLLGKLEWYVMTYKSYDQHDPKPENVHFFVEERIKTPGDPPKSPMEFLEYRENLPKDYENYPWDVVMIMTKKWILVARPKPQQAERMVQKQAYDIWEQVEKLLNDDKDREENDTIICWVFHPKGEVMTKIHDDIKPLPTSKSKRIYSEVFGECMQKMGWLKNRIFESRPYFFGKTTVYGQGITYRSQIAVYHQSNVPSASRALPGDDYQHFAFSCYASLGFPHISLNTQATTHMGDGCAEAVVTSRMVWSTQEMIMPPDWARYGLKNP